MTSKTGESLSVVVADVNALLSILVGKAASKVLETTLALHTAKFTWEEAMRYLPMLVDRYDVDPFLMKERAEQLDIRLWDKRSFRHKLEEATKLIKDPDDVELAALALHLDAPVWSNDNHFRNFPTGRFTTAQLLKILGF